MLILKHFVDKIDYFLTTVLLHLKQTRFYQKSCTYIYIERVNLIEQPFKISTYPPGAEIPYISDMPSFGNSSVYPKTFSLEE